MFESVFSGVVDIIFTEPAEEKVLLLLFSAVAEIYLTECEFLAVVCGDFHCDFFVLANFAGSALTFVTNPNVIISGRFFLVYCHAHFSSPFKCIVA